MMAREWDAESYERLAAPMTTRGIELLDRLELRGDETVVDAGLGTGQVTAALLERLPHGRVIGIDASAAMLDLASERFTGDARVVLVRADLEHELPIEGPVNAIVSTSTLHWIGDHGGLFRRFAALLKTGGQLVAEYGGHGNIAHVLQALAAAGQHEHPWTYPMPEEEAAHLRAAGFAHVDTQLVRRPAPIAPEDFEHYVRTVLLGWHLDRLSQKDGDRLVWNVIDALPDTTVDYVRLVLVARR